MTFSRFAAGWSVAALTLTTTLQVTAPVVAEAYRPAAGSPVVCPWPEERHKVSCPPPHTVTGIKVTCLTTTRLDRCASL